jgi:hypothetical protein
MTVPIHISWDLFQGQMSVWSECLVAGVRRAVLLPRLDTIFSPREEDPAREREYDTLDWRLVSPTEQDWTHYRALVEKAAARAGLQWRAQRVENLGRWAQGRSVPVPQYHLWMFREAEVGSAIERLYEELDPRERRRLWTWLLAWTSPAGISGPYQPR